MMGKRKAAVIEEEDALVYNDGPQDGLAIKHVSKKQQRMKGLEIVFDPDGHKEYVTGFHKRKVQRRKAAIKHLEAKERQKRVEDRAQRKAELRKQLDLDRYETDSEAEQEVATEALLPAGATLYKAEGTTTVVTTTPLALHSDSEVEEEGPASKQLQHTHRQLKPKQTRLRKVQKHAMHTNMATKGAEKRKQLQEGKPGFKNPRPGSKAPV